MLLKDLKSGIISFTMMSKETFYWMDENYETREYPISKLKKIVLGEVGEGQETSEDEEHTDIQRIFKREILPEWRVEEELKKARTVVIER